MHTIHKVEHCAFYLASQEIPGVTGTRSEKVFAELLDTVLGLRLWKSDDHLKKMNIAHFSQPGKGSESVWPRNERINWRMNGRRICGIHYSQLSSLLCSSARRSMRRPLPGWTRIAPQMSQRHTSSVKPLIIGVVVVYHALWLSGQTKFWEIPSYADGFPKGLKSSWRAPQVEK